MLEKNFSEKELLHNFYIFLEGKKASCVFHLLVSFNLQSSNIPFHV